MEDLVEIVDYDPTHIFFESRPVLILGIRAVSMASPRWNTERSSIGAGSRRSTTRDLARSGSTRRRTNFASAIGSNRVAIRPAVSIAVFEVTCPTSPSAERTDGH